MCRPRRLRWSSQAVGGDPAEPWMLRPSVVAEQAEPDGGWGHCPIGSPSWRAWREHAVRYQLGDFGPWKLITRFCGTAAPGICSNVSCPMGPGRTATSCSLIPTPSTTCRWLRISGPYGLEVLRCHDGAEAANSLPECLERFSGGCVDHDRQPTRGCGAIRARGDQR